MKKQLCLVVALLFGVLYSVHANTSLDDSYCPLPEGNCTAAPIAGLEKTGPPYSGANTNPWIAEGVSSGSVGRTCNFNPNNVPLPAMPQLYKDFWLLAASQDLYNGRHLGTTTWDQECEVKYLSYSDADTGANVCAAACGQCFIISGPRGSGVWIVNEIADYGAVGQNGIGLNFHLDDNHALLIREWGGVSKDIYFKPVPCPVTGGMSIYTWGNYGDNAIYFVVANHRNAIKAVHARGGAGGNQTWVPLARDWTNRWHWETYGCADCPPFQTGWGSIQRGSTNNDFELQITSIYDEKVVCTQLTAVAAGMSQTCVDVSSTPQQFSCGGAVSLQGCGYNTTLVNGGYYSGSLSGCSASKPACATKAAWTSGSSEASSSSSFLVDLTSADPLGLFL